VVRSRILQILSAIFSCFARLEDCAACFYLKVFPFHLPQRFVIGDLADQIGYLATEEFLEFRKCGFGVLDGVVQSGGDKSRVVVHLSLHCKDRCDLDGMVDVGRRLRVLPTLVTMLVCGKGDGFQEIGRSQIYVEPPSWSSVPLFLRTACYELG